MVSGTERYRVREGGKEGRDEKGWKRGRVGGENREERREGASICYDIVFIRLRFLHTYWTFSQFIIRHGSFSLQTIFSKL